MPESDLRPAARALDERTKVTNPSGWIALIAVLVVVLVGVVVAFRVHLPDTVTVPATVSYAGGEIVVTSTGEGIVDDIFAIVGSEVEQGDELLAVRDADGKVTTYSAPVGGAVLRLAVKIGQGVARGAEIARLTRPSESATVDVVAFVSPTDAVHFSPGAPVDVLIDDQVIAATVTTRADRRSSVEAMSEVLGAPSLALPVFEAAGGAPLAVTVQVPNAEAFADGTVATLRRVVADPTVWDVLTGGDE